MSGTHGACSYALLPPRDASIWWLLRDRAALLSILLRLLIAEFGNFGPRAPRDP